MIALLAAVDGETGAISSMPILYIIVCTTLAITVISQSRAFSTVELIIWIVINILYLGLGMSFFVYQYEVSTFKYDLNSRSEKQEAAAIFVTTFCFMTPTFAHGLVCALTVLDNGFERLKQSFKFFAISTVVGLVCMIVCVFLFVHWIEGIAFLGGLILFTYFCSQLYLYIVQGF
jgi:hypothetical protein